MSDSPSRLPARPSLEQLRKQAKDRLRTLRARRPEITLAEVQFGVAREYGFESWSALVHHVEAVNPPGLRKFDDIANELADAYMAGDAEAVREIGWTYGIYFAHDKDAGAMQQRLPAWFAASRRTRELAVGDARALVARKAGFDSWEALAASLAVASAPATHTGPRDLPFCRMHPDHGMAVEGVGADGHWPEILAAIVDRGVNGVLVNGLSERGAVQLAQATSVTRLTIAGAQASDDAVRHLAAMAQLEELHLGGPKCAITDRGLEVLRHLPNLRVFTMAWAPRITDAGAGHLAACDRLEDVDLMGTPTGDGALWALSGKPHLVRVKTGRLVSNKGIEVLHFFPRFKRWHGGELKYDLMSFGVEPTNLLLDGPFTDAGLAHLTGLEGLAGLNLFWHTPGFTPGGLQALAGLPNLVFVGVDGKRCNDDAMRAAAGIPRLRMLMAQGTIASDAGFEALARSQTLEYLWGRECPNLTGRGFAALATMPALRGLAVSCARVDDDRLALLPRFPSLTSLMPMDVHDEGFRHVGRSERLERLWCMYCRDTTDAATEHLAGLSRLAYYYAGMTKITDRSLEILAGLTTLEQLEFWEVAGITDAGLAALATLPRLREISIGGSPRVTRAGAGLFPATVNVRLEG
jgi:hypothetical protein